MKLTFLIQPDIKQLVLTPESKEEKAIFALFPKDTETVMIKRGSFFESCRGGWIREYEDDDSLILVISNEVTKKGG